MKIIIIRHADPDYVNDSLTKTGIKEAEALIPRMEKIHGDHYYVSPLGRARLTAKIALSETNVEPVVLDFLREFPAKIEHKRDPETGTHCWDWLPLDWADDKCFYDIDTLFDHPVMKEGNVRDVYEKAIEGFDQLLAKHGYKKKGNVFEVLNSNHDTIVLFCHFGIECVLLSYLLNISPMPLWHGFVAPPSSVTTIHSEEREKGIASFRVQSFGDISHLYARDMGPSFAARFCECYEDDTRH
ncbi:MAG: histidine phosphatase family protein [Erysipelotrichaceae bacterium]|nr:histidine phosphatase family protein [Erysipelotrichaceae bacterium]